MFFLKFSQRFMKYSSFLDSHNSSRLRILQRRRCPSSRADRHRPTLFSPRFLPAPFARENSRPQEPAASAARNASPFWPSTARAKSSWAKRQNKRFYERRIFAAFFLWLNGVPAANFFSKSAAVRASPLRARMLRLVRQSFGFGLSADKFCRKKK